MVAGRFTMNPQNATRSKAVLLAALFFGATCSECAVAGAEAGAAADSPLSGQILTAHLEYQPVNFTFVNWGVPTVAQSAAFKKEPVFSGGKIIRGTFQFSGNASNWIAFAWDRNAGKLYLDLNRNLDLTDDPAGVFVRQGNFAGNYQSFTGIHLPFETPTGHRQMLVDLTLSDYGAQPGCTAAIRSLWQGKITLQGEDWQVGITENPFERSGSAEASHLLLRRWEARNKPFSAYTDSMEVFPFSRRLFVQSHAYQLDYTNESKGDDTRMKLQFTEQQPALGELKISGDFVQHVILDGGPYLVLIDKPETVVRVPVGSYNQPKVWLKKGGTEAYRNSNPMQQGRRFAIDEKKPALLAAGGPLTNSVTVTRHGQYLNLGYQLIGAGGEGYQLTGQDRTKPPEFAIYKGDRKIASGKFEFG
jgi:hypothetical protein